MKKKIFASIALVLAYWFVAAIFGPIETLITGDVAGDQFDNSNAAYLIAMSAFNGFGFVHTLVLLALGASLAYIWSDAGAGWPWQGS